MIYPAFTPVLFKLNHRAGNIIMSENRRVDMLMTWAMRPKMTDYIYDTEAWGRSFSLNDPDKLSSEGWTVLKRMIYAPTVRCGMNQRRRLYFHGTGMVKLTSVYLIFWTLMHWYYYFHHICCSLNTDWT